MVPKATAPPAGRRPAAYTLIELLVVIAIIAFLAGMVIVLWPGFASSTASTSNADKAQAMLGIAKQRAIRDRVATGVRLIPKDPTNPNSPVRELIYVQQPEPFTPPITTTSNGTVVGTLMPTPVGPGVGSPQGSNLVTFDFDNGVNFTGGQALPSDYPVQIGDYLEVNGGGSVHLIMGVSANALLINDTIIVATRTTNWRIIRAPRPVPGEEPLELSGDIIIDLMLSRNVPTRTVAGTPFREILFAPSGSVIGRGTQGNDKIILYVRDGSRTRPTDGEPVLIAIQIGTGFIGGYPVDVSNPTGDLYSNTRDPHASGL
jgi:prepilin-type N-terminal cleavage/methylation domain-containing protein